MDCPICGCEMRIVSRRTVQRGPGGARLVEVTVRKCPDPRCPGGRASAPGAVEERELPDDPAAQG